jgi:DUF1680 family protein
MKIANLPMIVAASLILAGHLPAADPATPIVPVPFTDVRITGGLLGQRQETNRAVTLPFALEQCEKADRLKNFDLAAETMRRRAAGETSFQNKPPTSYTFDDTDVYKSIEGAAFSLSLKPDPELASLLERMIARVAAAQEPDGYLYTWRTMHPDSPVHDWIGQNRWEKDPILSHELYNLGHLYEAGVAHFQATGSRTLLDICLKSAELVYKDLADGDPPIATGHQVIEMGLTKLFLQTGDQRWLNLAKVLIDNRGKGGGSEYSQNHQQVVEQSSAVGHAVRANYMYSGMADVAAANGNEAYLAAITRIWDNVVGRKLYLTGGCGARSSGEAYGDDYELPHNGYNETCAAIAFLFWNQRMFLMTGEAKYMDVFERALYNGVISGVSLSGDRFFYPNPLVYDGKTKNNHGHAGRAPWFGCACCPPNIMRLLASLGGYVHAVRGKELFVNLYASGEASAKVAATTVRLTQTTNYPWDGAISLRLDPEKPAEFTLSLRIPGWVRGQPLPSDLYRYDDPAPAAWSVRVNGETIRPELRDGYATLTRNWKKGDTVELHFDMPVRRVAGNDKIAATRGQVALERGPVVYAFEAPDNAGNLADLALPASATFIPEHRPDLLQGVTILNISGAARRTETGESPTTLTAIPYASWNNRGLSAMRVWLPRDVSQVPPPPKPTIASQAALTVSFQRPGMDASRVNDQLVPLNATDGFAPNFDFWPHKGTAEWLQYSFQKPTSIRSINVSWFDDTGIGECRLPASWRLLYQTQDGKWQPVETNTYPVRKAEPVTVTFPPVTTTAIRLELQLAEGFSAGLYEWSVE